MELLAAGFNAWHQLQFDNKEDTSDEPDDITSFRSVLKDDTIGHPCALLSCTFVKTASGIRRAGFVEDIPERIKDKLLSSTAAIAGNGIIAGGPIPFVSFSWYILLTEGLEYDGHDSIYQYPSRPIAHAGEPQKFSGMGRIIQLVAYETGFYLPWETGDAFEVGLNHLRPIKEWPTVYKNNNSPAEKPGPAEELQDLPTGKITKISAAGYLILALTEGHDLYAWGGHPGRRALIDDLSSSPVPVVVEECDIADCGVGESHIIILSTEGDVYVIGDNANGQLGLPVNEVVAWTKVPLHLGVGQAVLGVGAGRRTSFILTKYQVH
ncbi:hypothetical protein AAE478_005569 [Parahypoxylon ruwenzoriense]